MRPWGKLYRMTNVVNFQLSPYEQKAFHGLLKGWRNYFFNIVPTYLPWIAGPTVVSYLAYEWSIQEHDKCERKNPKDFENEV